MTFTLLNNKALELLLAVDVMVASGLQSFSCNASSYPLQFILLIRILVEASGFLPRECTHNFTLFMVSKLQTV